MNKNKPPAQIRQEQRNSLFYNINTEIKIQLKKMGKETDILKKK